MFTFPITFQLKCPLSFLPKFIIIWTWLMEEILRSHRPKPPRLISGNLLKLFTRLAPKVRKRVQQKNYCDRSCSFLDTSAMNKLFRHLSSAERKKSPSGSSSVEIQNCSTVRQKQPWKNSGTFSWLCGSKLFSSLEWVTTVLIRDVLMATVDTIPSWLFGRGFHRC